MPTSDQTGKLIAKALRSTGECASIDELDRIAREPFSHATSCIRCSAEMSLLRDFERATPRASELLAAKWIAATLERRLSARPARRARQAWWMRWLTVPALSRAGFALGAAMLVVAVGVGLWQGRPPSLAVSDAPATAFRSARVTAVSPAGDLDAAPTELRWEQLAAAASYSVRVMEVDRAELWRAVTGDTRVALPAPVSARALPGKTLLWQVIAKDAHDREVGDSGVQRFRVRLHR